MTEESNTTVNGGAPPVSELNPDLDPLDLKLMQERARTWQRASACGPMVGDFVDMPDGSRRRFTHDWGDSIQTTCGPAHPCSNDQSFYLGEGFASFSGSLDPAIRKCKLAPAGEYAVGRFWFFHHEQARAHNGVKVSMFCKVWRVQA
jgi:hypothetical protein